MSEIDEKTTHKDDIMKESSMPKFLSKIFVESNSVSEIDCKSEINKTTNTNYLNTKPVTHLSASLRCNLSSPSFEKSQTFKNSETIMKELSSTAIITESGSDSDIEYDSDYSDLSAVPSKVTTSAGPLQTVEASPSIGTINVSDSNDVHIGNKTYINGPVTIKQFVQAKTEDNVDIRCVDNPAFVSSASDFNTPNLSVQPPLHLEYHNWKCKGVLWIEKRWGINLRCKTFLLSLFCTFVIVLICIMFVLIIERMKVPTVLAPSSDKADVVIDTSNESSLLPSLSLRMVERKAWVAQPPNDVLDPLQTPVPYVIITHTATEGCINQSSCIFHVRYIQSFHIESNGWNDIGYNFLVGGDGSAYEGRGWDYVGAHTKGYNIKSIGIAFIGTFTVVEPPERQYVAAKRLIQLGVESGKIARDYKLYGHRQLIPTESPGKYVFNELQKWPHFSTDTPTI